MAPLTLPTSGTAHGSVEVVPVQVPELQLAVQVVPGSVVVPGDGVPVWLVAGGAVWSGSWVAVTGSGCVPFLAW